MLGDAQTSDAYMMRYRAAICASLVALAACTSDKAPDTTAFRSDRITIAPRGSGNDVLLVHGVGGHPDLWAGIADSLDDSFRVHLVHINGFSGAAPGANADGPVAAPVAEEIARYVREADIERPVLVGHSMGGAIGMMLAARHPDLLGALMVIDMPPFLGAVFAPPGAPADSIRKIADGLRAGFHATPADSPTVFDQMVPTMTRNDSAKAVLLRHARASHRPTVGNAMHELIVTDLRPELPRITAPVTVLYVVPPNIPMNAAQFDQVTRQSFASLRGARLVRVNDSNHYIQIDQPGRVVAEIRSLAESRR